MSKRHRGVLLLSGGASHVCVSRMGADDRTHHGVAEGPAGCRASGRDSHVSRARRCRAAARHRSSDQDGVFRFLSLPPGRYTVKVELAGFKTLEQPDVQVGLDRTVDLVLTLQVQGVAETVNVTSASPIVDTTSTSIGVNADRRPVRAASRCAATSIRLRVSRPGTTEDAVGPGGARIDRRGEPVHHRWPEHDRHRARREDQAAELRLHRSDRREDRRLECRIRPDDGRRHRSHHASPAATPSADRCSASPKAAPSGPTIRPRPSRPADHDVGGQSRQPVGRRRSKLGGFLVKDGCGSSAPTTGSRSAR